MANENTINAVLRTEKGTTSVRRLRGQGMIPGIVNDDKCGSVAISINEHDFSMMLHHHTSEHLVLGMQIDKNPVKKVLLKDVQRDPISGKPLHAEFTELSMTKKMKVKVLVILKGEPVGVTQEGGIMEQLMREVEIECLPDDVVESFVVDVSALKMNQMMSVSAIQPGSKITILTDKALPLVTVLEPRKEEEVAPDAAAAAAAAGPVAPEVIGEKEREEKAKAKGEEKGGAKAGAAPAAKAGAAPAAKAGAAPAAKKEAKK